MADNEAAEEATESTPASEVRGHLHGARSGALATICAVPELAGIPFGSVVPFALTARGEPVILTASIAQHTRNIKADARASLMVQQPDVQGDPQTGWRVTLMGTMERLVVESDEGPARQISAEEMAQVAARYREVVPAADRYHNTHNFEYWVMNVQRVRYIGGFGKIHWVEADDYLVEPAPLEGAERIIEHMNDDHADAIVDYCHGLAGFQPAAARLTAVDSGGFFVEADDKLHRFSFEAPIDGEGARHAFVDLLKHARERIGAGA